jgi:hypothetical protein
MLAVKLSYANQYTGGIARGNSLRLFTIDRRLRYFPEIQRVHVARSVNDRIGSLRRPIAHIGGVRNDASARLGVGEVKLV